MRAHLVSDVPVGVLPLRRHRLGRAGGARREASRPSRCALLDRLRGELVRRAVRRPQGRPVRDRPPRARAPAGRRRLPPALAEAFDEPFADSSALPTYLVSELAAAHVKVALSGEGGDELFGGYYTYVADLLAPRAGRLRGSRGLWSSLLPSPRAKASFDYRAKRFVRARTCRRSSATTAGRRSSRRPARGAHRSAQRLRSARPLPGAVRETDGAELLARLQDVDERVYLVDDLLVKTDRASMAHSLEARVPFCDRVVASFAHALPSRQKVRGLRKKVLLRRRRSRCSRGSVVAARSAGSRFPPPRGCAGSSRASHARR